MLDISEIKTRDIDVLNDTIVEMVGLKKGLRPVEDLETLIECVEKIQCQTWIIYDRETGKWVFTDSYDEYLLPQDYFNRMNFVIVEQDLNLALARGIHYRYHKKGRE